jgi:hypothetical protein
MTEHLPGHPVSATTYRKVGCRCARCCAASTEKARQYRKRVGGTPPSSLAYQAALAHAGRWVRDTNPEQWMVFLARAREQLGLPTDIVPGGGRFSKPIQHGTLGGYQTHHYRGEPPCADCRDARREYDRNRRAAS